MNKLGEAKTFHCFGLDIFCISPLLSPLSFPQRLMLIGDPSYCSCMLQYPHQPAYFRAPDANSEPKLRAQNNAIYTDNYFNETSYQYKGMTGGRTHCKSCVCLQTRIYGLLLRRSHSARYLFALLLSAMPNEILALQAQG